jgi:lysine-ketoglutarate reductase/saccharopine dehydrogenase-like protein (TIGR00300 family)
MPATETVEISGHIIDSLILAKILDEIIEAQAEYRIVDMDVGRGPADLSRARLEVIAADDDALAAVLSRIHPHGAHPLIQPDAELVPATIDGVLPAGFYSTTNLPTSVKVRGKWLEVENPEMDCGLVVSTDQTRVWSAPMHRVVMGDQVVVGEEGVRVTPLARPQGRSPFEFMTSDVSSEKPKGLLVAEVSERIRRAKAAGGKLLAVCGPALIHTGAGPDLATLVREGFVDVLFAGNGFATHDIESNTMGTSLGVHLREGHSTEGGHSNHLRTINEVRRWGSIRNGVERGALTSGVMYECIQRDVPFVLAGSIRDDGPLPDVITDAVAAVDTMRAHLDGVRVSLMLATTLHAIATGNILPAGVETYCVDINQAVVTKLADRGSHQALGIVTDIGLFLRDLAENLAPHERSEVRRGADRT